MLTFYKLADGQQVDEAVATDHRGVLKAGYKMRSGLMLMDSEPDASVKRVENYDHMVSNAWRGPQPKVAPLVPTPRLADGSPDIDAIYEAADRRLSNAWRHPL